MFPITTQAVTQGLPYDLDSIMQLAHKEYSKNNLSTIIPVNDITPKEMLGQSTEPSQQDYLDINLTYCGEINVFSVHESNFFNDLVQAKH